MNKKILVVTGIVGGVTLLGYAIYNYIYKQTKLLQDFDYKIIGVKFTAFSLNLVKGNINIVFTSKADIEFVIEQYVLNFSFNGKQVGYLEDLRPFVIPAKASSQISSEFTINPQLIFKNISDIIQYSAATKDASFAVKGYVKVKSNFVKLTVPIEYSTTIKEILSS
jgi:hypothetical protein